MVGGVPGRVTVAGQPLADIGAGDLGHMAHAVAVLAGPFAGQLEHRQEHRLRDGEWQPFLDRVRSGSPGRCDECVVARLGIVAGCPAGRLATDAEALRWLRRAEALTLKLLREPSVWTAVRRLAAELREHGTLPGSQVEVIVASCVPNGLRAAIREEIANVEDR